MGGMQVLEWAVMYPERVAIDRPDRHVHRRPPPSRSGGGRPAGASSAWTRKWRGGDYYDAAPGDGPARGPRPRPHGEPDHLPLRRRVHRPLRPRGRRTARTAASACGSASRSSATSSTTATSSCAASTPTPTCCSRRRWTSTTSAAAGAASTPPSPACRRPLLAIGVSSDVLYPAYQSREIVELAAAAGVRAEYVELDSPHGHDGFLIETEQVGDAVAKFLATIGRRVTRRRRQLETTAVTAGRRFSKDSLAPVLFPSTTYEVDERRRAPAPRRHGPTVALLLALRQPDGPRVRGRRRRARGRRGRARLRVGHGGDHRRRARPVRARATTSSPRSSCSRSPRAVPDAPAPLRHRRHDRRRHRRRGASPPPARPEPTQLLFVETPANPVALARRPRRRRRHQRARSRSSTRRSPPRPCSARSTTASTS